MILATLLACKPDCSHTLDEFCAREPESCVPLPAPGDLPADAVVYACGDALMTRVEGKDSFAIYYYDAVSRRFVGKTFWNVDTPLACPYEEVGQTFDCDDPVVVSGTVVPSPWPWITGGTGGSPATGDTGRP